MKNIIRFTLLIVLFNSCTMSNNSSFTKRKYTKGVYTSKKTIITPKRNQLAKNNLKNKTNNNLTSKKVITENNPTKKSQISFSKNTLNHKSKTTIEKQICLSSKSNNKKLISPKRIINNKLHKRSDYNTSLNNSNNRKLNDDGDEEDKKLDEKIILGLLLCFLGFAPFGILIVLGKGPKYKKNLFFWILGYVFIIASSVIFMFIFFAEIFPVALIITSILLSIAAIVFLMISLIDGLITILNEK